MLRKASIPAGAILTTTVLLVSLTSPAFADTAVEADAAQEGRWVAVGDSFQSGVGAGNYDDDSGDCLRSPASHIEILNDGLTIPAELDFVACSGARIDDLYTGRHGEPAQLDAIDTGGAEISHVSVGIGGNDVNFADNLRDCILFGWPWSSCESRFDEGVDADFRALLEQNPDGHNSFQQLYTDIRDAAGDEDLTLMVFTYPKFFPPDGGSDFSSIPFQPRCQGIRVSDQLWINNWIQRLNTAIIDSAHSVGATPIDLYPASDGHELCHPDGGEGYLNGVRFSSDAFHPTAFGYDQNAELIRAQLDHPVNVPVPLRATPLVEPPETPRAEVRVSQDDATITADATGSVAGDGTIETYLWEFDDGELVDDVQASHTYDEPGTYYLTLTVIDSNEEMGFSAPYEVVVE